MTKEEQIAKFNPNGVGISNGNFIGLPFNIETAQVVLLPVPWDVTVSFADGTSTGPENILACSTQLDLYDPELKDAWKVGIFFKEIDNELQNKGISLRKKAKTYIKNLESGKKISSKSISELKEINIGCEEMNQWVESQCIELMNKGKMIGLIGGDHSTPLGYLRALSQKHVSFGVLHIDAHFDLRSSYEGFTYSHASIFYNARNIKAIEKFVHVGIRDYCEEELEIVKLSKDRNLVFSDNFIQNMQFKGHSFKRIANQIIEHLPEKVYISFDIDGLVQHLCPNTGTPVPGGLEFNQAIYIIKRLVKSGKQIIGFDVVETAGIGNEWDGNVSARIIYKLINLMSKSNNF
jgi:agmatinase